MAKEPHEIATEEAMKIILADPDYQYKKRMVYHCIVNREEAYDYIATYNLKVNYTKELKDGTPRRIWELRDSEGEVCGSMITAVGQEGTRNRENYTKDSFDFMEIKVDRRDFIDPNTTISPRTQHFINKENEENEKE